MRRIFSSLAAAVLVATLAFLTLAHFESKGAADRWREDAALSIARAVANAAAYGPGSEQLQGLVERLDRELPELEELFLLKGTKYEAHSKKELAGARLNPDSLEDKAFFDASNRVKATVQKNIEERERLPELDRDAYAEYELALSPGGVAIAVVPVEDGAGFRGVVRAVVRATPPAAPFPSMIVVFALAAIAFGALLSRMARGAPPRLAAPVVLGSLLLAALMIADAGMLVSWRDQHRRAEAQLSAELLLAVARAGGLEGLPQEGAGAFVSAIAKTRDGRPLDSLLAVRSSTVGAPAIPGGVPIERAPWEAVWSARGFETARAEDARQVRMWSVLFGAVALAIWVLGALGYLLAGGRAVARHRQAYAYLSPAMLAMAILVFIPVVFGIVIGFMARRYNVFEFAGLANYVAILSNFDLQDTHNFYFKLGVTVLWTVTNVALHVSIGLFLALLLNDEMLKARGIYRVLLIVPWAIPNYITALIWRGLFHKQFGAINFFIEALGAEPVSWFQSFWTAFSTNLATNTWLGFPFMMVVSLGALQSIPGDLYEAAYVDGASRWQRFRKITLPLLMPALVPAVIVGTVWTFNMFNIIYLVSGGAPDGATDILITDAFRWAFERDQYGYAAAYSTLIFVILLLFTLATNRITGATKGAFD